MSYEIKIEVIDNYVSVTVSGKYHHKSAKQGLYEVLDTCYKNDLTRILVDHRQQEGRQNLIQRLDYIIYITTAINDLFPKVKPRIRVAYLGPSEQNNEDDKKIDKIVNQSGTNILGTSDPEYALKWLQEEMISD